MDTMHVHTSTSSDTPRLTFLGKGGSEANGCPSLYSTDRATYMVQGWRTDDPATVELPHLLLGFLEPTTFIGAALQDTGRGTFLVTGRPVAEPATLAQMEIADNETAIEVEKRERVFFGVVGQR